MAYTAGIFSGTTGAIHSVVGELADSTNESVAFPLYDIVSAVGFAVGYIPHNLIRAKILAYSTRLRPAR